VDEKNDQIAHRGIVAGREILMNYGRNNNSPETRKNSYTFDTSQKVPVTVCAGRRTVTTMDQDSIFPEKHLPSDIVKLAIDQHGQVIRLSYMEIASGITRLLRQGIPKEVICQVLNQAVEALAQGADASP
jgi:hypothetical protein